MPFAEETASADRVFAFDRQTVRRLMPHRHPMALLDRVESYSARDRKAVVVKEVSLEEPVFEGHFPDEPLFPGSLVLEALAQACGLVMNIEYLLGKNVPLGQLAAAGASVRLPSAIRSALVESKIKQLGLVYPGDRLYLEIRLAVRRNDMGYFKVRAFVNGAVVAQGDMMLAYPAYLSD